MLKIESLKSQRTVKAVVIIAVLLMSLFILTGCEGVTTQDYALTLEKFNQIQNGMTYEQVIEIIGEEGTLTSEVGEPGSPFHTVMYSFYGRGSIGANASFTFQGGELTAKAQFGLE